MKNLLLEVRMTLVLGDKQMNLISEDYLMHYGVKGMKWGVRHDKNPDGSLTRYGKKQKRKEIAAYRKKQMAKYETQRKKSFS